MPTLAAPLDCAKLETRNERVHQLSTAPSSPVTGQMYYNTTDNTLYWWNNTAWVAAAGGSPSGAAGGDLAGTYPNPDIKANTIVLGDCNSSMSDQTGGTACLRSLGLTAITAMAGNTRLDTITAPTGSVSLNGQKITNVSDPTISSDAATKNYVDTFAQGLDSHPSVKAATTANITLTANQTVDGVALLTADRCLVKDQTLSQNNGIYLVASGAWVRATDQDTWAEVPSAYVWVEQGTVNADSGWTSTADAGGTLGTTPMPWTQFSGAGSITAGAGLTKTGNTLDVVGSSTIAVAADSIAIAANSILGATHFVAGAVDLATGQVSNTLPIVRGGTGAGNAVSARASLGCAGYYSSATHGAGTTITILQSTHLLAGGRGLIVQCQIDATGAVILPDILINAGGDVTITFSVSQSANTIRTTIIG